VDLPGLVRQARQANGIIEFVPQVGDFVAVDEPLYRLHGGTISIDDHRSREAVVLGVERTMEQDPSFAVRILVDIAIEALSAAINDPTTAVMAIDQLHRHAELRQQLELLGRTIDGHYGFPEDRVLAYIPDPQGLGGAVGVQPVSEAPATEGGSRSDLP